MRVSRRGFQDTTRSPKYLPSGERSLSQFHRDQLHNDHEAGRLEAKIAEHSAADDSLAKSVAEDQAKIDRGAP